MNLQQLHIIREAAKQGFNLTTVARSMAITQPAVSRHIRELERELGVSLFFRHGKRLLGLTPVGKELLPIASRMLDDMYNIRQLATIFTANTEGTLRIASENFIACHQLPHVIKKFRDSYANLRLTLQQGSEQDLLQQLLEDKVDVLVTTTLMREIEAMEFIPCCRIPSKILVRHDHPLLLLAQITLPQLAAFPLITYPTESHQRTQLDLQFQKQELLPNIILSTHDADLICHYVEQGLGVGIVPGVIIGASQYSNLRILDASHLFADDEIGVLFHKGLLLHDYVKKFLELCRSELSGFLISAAIHPQVNSIPGSA